MCRLQMNPTNPPPLHDTRIPTQYFLIQGQGAAQRTRHSLHPDHRETELAERTHEMPERVICHVLARIE